jgi:PKD repeat protein
MKASQSLSTCVMAAALLAASCTMKNQDAPPLTGPSEFGTSLTVTVTPDVLALDGTSQSVVTVTARNSAGQLLPNLPMRADIYVNGVPADFGSLSAKSLVSGADGRAVVVYTAPASNAGVEQLIDITVTPIGTSAGNHQPISARIRLVPTGIRLPPVDLDPVFAITPSSPAVGQTVLFDAQASEGSIAEYRWDFGDGGTSRGETVSHAYSEVGTYFVRLTLVDSNGRTTSISRSVAVGQAPAPTADFTFSPGNPQPNDDVRFNAGATVPSPGRTIVSYSWDFGDGGSGSGVTATHRYTQARTYNVTLTVTDDIGRKSVVTKPVEVAVPDEDGGESPN